MSDSKLTPFSLVTSTFTIKLTGLCDDGDVNRVANVNLEQLREELRFMVDDPQDIQLVKVEV